MKSIFRISAVLYLLTFGWILAEPASADPEVFTPRDVFELEWATDPQISPDTQVIAYTRRHMDIMTDRSKSDIWLLDRKTGRNRPMTQDGDSSSPRWSPDGDRLLFLSGTDNGSQLFVRWMDSGEVVQLTRLLESPSNLSWSPRGDAIAFSMRVPVKEEDLVKLPEKPEGAEWAPKAKVIDDLIYRRDGSGYVEPGFHHIFVLPADGGTPRQVTRGDFDHQGAISWTADGKSLVFSANRHDDRLKTPNNSELFELEPAGGELRQWTDRFGPDHSPVVSPDGHLIAYLGVDDKFQGYQPTQLYVLDRRTGKSRSISQALDRAVSSPLWKSDSSGLFVSFNDEGNGKIASISLDGEVTRLAEDLGGTSLGRPYSSGSFSVSQQGDIAYTWGKTQAPADIAVSVGGETVRLTHLNDDLLGHKELAQVEEIWVTSSYDDRRIQGWIAKPPGFDPSKKYPLIMEIHGGPFANYGDRWSTEVQLFAAAGYVVLYMNPRGSTSYGEEFGNLIHHNYPGQDYDDLMSGIDAMIELGYVDPEQLFVTGGSGGGVLTAWIVGKTDRFAAAVSAKPVINWYSFALTADSYNFFYRYWFPGPPWEHTAHYMERSPLSLVGNVSTPTMLLTGEVDYRTPISETEQYYQALKLREIDTAMVRIPEASHGIAARPSHLISKVLHILSWFERYRK